MYYIQNNLILYSTVAINGTLLNEEQTTFYLANKQASVEEVLKCELNPIPEPPEPTEPLPTLEEIVESQGDALDELIQYVYGGA